MRNRQRAAAVAVLAVVREPPSSLSGLSVSLSVPLLSPHRTVIGSPGSHARTHGGFVRHISRVQFSTLEAETNELPSSTTDDPQCSHSTA